jgi:hypothetical protein
MIREILEWKEREDRKLSVLILLGNYIHYFLYQRVPFDERIWILMGFVYKYV